MEINQEVLFAEILKKIKKLARAQGNCIEEEQVREAFKELSMEDEQFLLVFDYLKHNKIGIGEPAYPDEYLSEEEINYLEEYQKELNMLEEVSGGIKKAVILSAMAGEAQAQQRLLNLYLPQVVEIAKLYTGQGVLLEDLIGEGNVALSMGVTMLGCLEHADEADGMLVRMVMDTMEDSITEAAQAASADQKLLVKVNKVAKQAKELAESLHRKVTAEELAEETGMSRKEIKDAMQMSGFAIEDLER